VNRGNDFCATRLPPKKRLLRGLHAALQASGVADLHARRASCAGAVILMYHSVAEAADAAHLDPHNHLAPAEFRRQMEFLAKHRRVVSLDKVAASLESGRPLPRGSVALTFDDGYRDNLTVAAPMLAEFGFPATLYLATSYLDAEENQWIDQAYGCFRYATAERAELPGAGEFDPRDAASAGRAYRAFCGALLAEDREGRRCMLSMAKARMRPAVEAPRLTLTWEEARELRRKHPSFALGAHTHNHLDLSAATPAAAAAELRRCVEAVERETGERPRHFSYPYGRRAPGFDGALAEQGFTTAVAAGEGVLVRPGADRYALARIEAGPPLRLFAFHTGGAYPALSRALTGRQ
jgi:peptidoglycan/xylan/chitin deacetylase (PgdA/CDA1 family)